MARLDHEDPDAWAPLAAITLFVLGPLVLPAWLLRQALARKAPPPAVTPRAGGPRPNPPAEEPR